MAHPRPPTMSDDDDDFPLAPPSSSSQTTLPSTEVPESPLDAHVPFQPSQTSQTAVIPSSLSPPPSAPLASIPGDYEAPTPQRVLESSSDELRTMLQASILEVQRLKTEVAHERLQKTLATMRADDESKRAAVELDMVRTEMHALRRPRQAKRDVSAASYLQLKMAFDEACSEVRRLKRVEANAKRMIFCMDKDNVKLKEEIAILLTRIRENREHFNLLCSPGGIFYNAVTPRTQPPPTPRQQRVPPPPPSSSSHQQPRLEGSDCISVLLHAATVDGNHQRPMAPRHSRNAQSMSSLPTTPQKRPRDPSLLPSVELVPQTEPARQRQRRSRESTISAGDDDDDEFKANQELARQAMQTVESAATAAAAARSAASLALRSSEPRLRQQRLDEERRGRDDERVNGDDDDQDELPHSRGGFSTMDKLRQKSEVTMAARETARLLADVTRLGLDRRRQRGDGAELVGANKRARRTGETTVGLGIQYGRGGC
ncbi:hypothetical protein CDD80_3185 [Ophiocordyceps camponoti-rufipedis]|uniref:Uncharacterized protein n=1 Tax=Ophiocordyceps camponoti-rufipedis TaxID=2004952 RepID=A0A2C5YXJ8_9HYPO|nr:hypothetical protein CDD80_3185 [Ophiocordyceps camponoti-rufipedis]